MPLVKKEGNVLEDAELDRFSDSVSVVGFRNLRMARTLNITKERIQQ